MVDDSSDSEVFITSDCKAFSTKERDMYIVHHPSVIPWKELVKGTIIAVILDPTYYEAINEEPELFWLAQIIHQKSPNKNDSEIIQEFKIVWFYSRASTKPDGFPSYFLDKDDLGEVFYKNILVHNIQLTLHNLLPIAIRRKIMAFIEKNNQ
jgi:hypothetical protein